MNKDAKFLKVKCKKCKNEQMLFRRASMQVKCLVCDNVLANSTGGIIDLKTNVIDSI